MPVGRLTVSFGLDREPVSTTAEFEADRVSISYGNPAIAAAALLNIQSALPQDFLIPLSEVSANWIGAGRQIAQVRRNGRGDGLRLILVDRDAKGASLHVRSSSLDEEEMLEWIREHFQHPELTISD